MRIWLDVTTLLSWNRAAVGIVRVESECAKYFLNFHDICFCNFNQNYGYYTNVDRTLVEKALLRVKQGGNASQSKPVFLLAESHGVLFPFKAGDIYISMGLDWDQKNLKYLYQLKQDIGFKILLFCYDIIPIHSPHLCVGDVAPIFAKYFTDVAWCADKILCISDYSRRSLSQFLQEVGAPIPDLSVVRLGSEVSEPVQPASASIIDILRKRYILFVSTIERRKNHETLYRAYTQLIDAGISKIPLLVFVGMPGWGVNDLLADLQFDPRIQPYIRILNHISDNDLAYLYRHAEFTVFPSLYEGWGLPVAESLAHGKFCLASNTASIPEVGGDLIDYLDPWDIPAWTEQLKYYFDHPEIVAEKEAKIRLQYRTTTWSETSAFILAEAKKLSGVENNFPLPARGRG
jgi:glycosyltransferase involved in cell wall biosynthesis